MKRYCLIAITLILWLVLVAASPSAEKSITWRDILAVAGIVVPLLFTAVAYLIRKKIQAEKELQDRKLDEIRQDLERENQRVKEVLDRLERGMSDLTHSTGEAHRDILLHQNACTDKYVTRDNYNHDLQAQKDHLVTIKELINQQAEAVDRLVKLF